jgi:hypothetical protein
MNKDQQQEQMDTLPPKPHSVVDSLGLKPGSLSKLVCEKHNRNALNEQPCFTKSTFMGSEWSLMKLW